MRLVRFLSFLGMLCFLLPATDGEEAPYFVTYDHQLEEPGNLEIATSSTMGVPRAGEKFYFAPYVEFEYGVAGRWTTGLYLESPTTSNPNTNFTGWGMGNPFPPLKSGHWGNPR